MGHQLLTLTAKNRAQVHYRSCGFLVFTGLALSGLVPGARAQQPASPAAPQLTGKIAQVNHVHNGTANISNQIVRTIKFVANIPNGEPSVPSATLKGLMDTKEGQMLNTNTLARDLDRLFNRQTGYMRSKGYIVDVSTDINIDPTSGVLTVPLVEAHIDQIRILGNKNTKTETITRELLSRPGDVLDENKLTMDLRRLYSTGLFDQIGGYNLEPISAGHVNVLVPVVEKGGAASAGAG